MNVLITGTGAGIGLAIARRFLREGHAVWGVDRTESPITEPGYRHLCADIRAAESLDLPQPEILINNAGTLEEQDAIAVNLEGTIRFTERFLDSPRLRSVLFIASASARNGAEFPRYVASKAGLVGYMKNLALTLAKRGVVCNSISPGGVITDDHYYVNKYAPFKMIDIIHYDATSGTGFDPVWHTLNDNIQHIDKNTLGVVGTTILQVLKNE